MPSRKSSRPEGALGSPSTRASEKVVGASIAVNVGADSRRRPLLFAFPTIADDPSR